MNGGRDRERALFDICNRSSDGLRLRDSPNDECGRLQTKLCVGVKEGRTVMSDHGNMT